jgi:hypothetical protein
MPMVFWVLSHNDKVGVVTQSISIIQFSLFEFLKF